MNRIDRWQFGAAWWPPSFKLPVEDSLVNVYDDGEARAFQFQLKWPVGTIFSSVNLLKRIGLEVDGRNMPQDRIYIILRGQKIKDFKKSNLTFNPVEIITVGVDMRGGLSPGSHEFTLTLEFAGSPGPAVTTNFSLKLGEKQK